MRINLGNLLLLVCTVICISNCSTLKPLNIALVRKYELTNDDMKNIQYYLSDGIVLRREIDSTDIMIPKERLRMVEGTLVEEIGFQEGLPGVCTFASNDSLRINFEGYDENLFLVFSRDKRIVDYAITNNGKFSNLTPKILRKRLSDGDIYKGKTNLSSSERERKSFLSWYKSKHNIYLIQAMEWNWRWGTNSRRLFGTEKGKVKYGKYEYYIVKGVVYPEKIILRKIFELSNWIFGYPRPTNSYKAYLNIDEKTLSDYKYKYRKVKGRKLGK